jgi:hypothetical protein
MKKIGDEKSRDTVPLTFMFTLNILIPNKLLIPKGSELHIFSVDTIEPPPSL